MTQVLYTSRTPTQQYQRCKRLRWLATEEGPDGRGLEPVKKSVHLVVGGAVHAGMEVLLREGQRELDNVRNNMTGADSSVQDQLNVMFTTSRVDAAGTTFARNIENMAVAAALAEFAKDFGEAGVEMDAEEAAAMQARAGLAQGQQQGMVAAQSDGGLGADSPIVIDFGDLVGAPPPTPAQINSDLSGFSFDVLADATITGISVRMGTVAAMPVQSDTDYLREELAALIEGMVRCWARRRWRGLLEQFEVLEVEQEGEWLLGEVPEVEVCAECSGTGTIGIDDQLVALTRCPHCDGAGRVAAPLHFLSRHDALLLERTTGYLYLQSFKTTGTWDRRKELDAQVDMQGLSEAVDVEKRFGEAWELIYQVDNAIEADAAKFQLTSVPLMIEAGKRLAELVSPRVTQWLATLPDPPSILGVRYEYLLKGSRKKARKDPFHPDRYVQESILCRAWKQEGITADDRRWAWTYDWFDEAGKGRKLDYRSWQKAPVWQHMPVAEWIDRLERGDVQGEAMTAEGERMDPLAEQLVPVVVQYRNRDESLDLLEQLEAQEVQVARDAEAVREAERHGGYAAKRSALNRLFPMTRTACSYPGVCEFRSTPTRLGFCFGAPDPEHDATVMEHYRVRVPNHPQELVQLDSEKSS